MATTTTNPSSVSLEQLASTISSATSKITKFLQDNGHPQPSFAADSPADFPSEAPLEVVTARMDLLTAARQLQFLALWPKDSVLMNFAMQYHDPSTLQRLTHFNIPSAVPLEPGSSISYSALAAQTALEEDRLTRVLGYAMMSHIFHEPKVGFVAHTAHSAVLARDKGMAAFVGHCHEEVFPASAKLVEATEAFGHSNSAINTGFNLAFDTELDAMGFIGKDPVRAARFAQAMVGLSSSSGLSAAHIANGFDWQALGNGVVVDVGGSDGHVSKSIAASAPQLSFIIQDQAEAVAKGKSDIAPSLADRFTFSAHDFMTPNPVEKGKVDVFLLRFILHDWPEDDSITILKNLVPSMVPGKTKVVVCDTVVPNPGEIPIVEERFTRALDLQMMTALNARERSVPQWEALFQAAGLKIVKRSKPLGSMLSLIEAVVPE